MRDTGRLGGRHAAPSALVAIVLVVLVSCAAGCKDGSEARFSLQSPSAPPFVLEDDFTTDRGYVGNVPNEIFVDTASGTIRWHADRNRVQYLAYPIPPVSGDVTIEVVGQIDWAQNNCAIHVGLAESLTPVVSDRDPAGLYVELGFLGGGCRNHFYLANAWAQFSDGTSRQMSAGHTCDVDDGAVIKIDAGRAYRCVLKVTGDIALYTVHDEATGDLVDAAAFGILKPIGPYRYLLVGNFMVGDWPVADGSIDRIRVSSP